MEEKRESPLDATFTEWEADILGEDFVHSTLTLEPSYLDKIDPVATLVRHKPDNSQGPSSSAVLYVHGMTDYFFQRHLATAVADVDWDFYALDLRYCGRSHRKGQIWHHAHQISQYHPELTAAVRTLAADHERIVLVGHSTGGLVLANFISHLRHTEPDLYAVVKGMVFNSPWLDMQYPALITKTLTPVVMALGALPFEIPLPGGLSAIYGKALHRNYQGEWDYDLRLKPLLGHPKKLSWLRAVIIAQHALHRGDYKVDVPTLVLRSDHSWSGKVSIAKAKSGDGVLDVEQIRDRSCCISTDVEVRTIKDGIHDLFLSQRPVRDEAIGALTEFLQDTADDCESN